MRTRINIQSIARKYQITPQTVHRYIKERRSNGFPFRVSGGRTHYFHQDEIEEWFRDIRPSRYARGTSAAENGGVKNTAYVPVSDALFGQGLITVKCMSTKYSRTWSAVGKYTQRDDFPKPKLKHSRAHYYCAEEVDIWFRAWEESQRAMESSSLTGKLRVPRTRLNLKIFMERLTTYFRAKDETGDSWLVSAAHEDDGLTVNV